MQTAQHFFSIAEVWSQPASCSVTAREQERKEIQQQVQAFINSGGKITVLPSCNSNFIPSLTNEEKRVLKKLYVRGKAAPVNSIPKKLETALSNLNHKHLVWVRRGFVDLTGSGHYAATQMFNIAGLL